MNRDPIEIANELLADQLWREEE
ncbi:hypothetical protein KIY79_gp88 [Mycobacterium phage Anselm]|uniref:Uncharacterized protein n=1 Tax=Mycobacterium phage Anselm TaxID=2041517 RepID=A0A2D1G5G6_9CAUD|nr:hypothetical protein KIY79_gp88 [Mycobacterium phage Anselm]ATN87086.1 hypothetical protein SEA_ANSELM_88 [Mycobacterium phage Anselm]